MFSFLKPKALKLLSNLVYFSLMLETLQASLSVPCKRIPFLWKGGPFLNLNFVWRIWIWCCEFEFGVVNLNSVWAIWIWCGEFKFGVSNLNLVWWIWIWCEQFEFGVVNLNSVWAIWIWCGEFEFGVSNLNLVWWIWILCEQFEFGVSNLNSVCTCGPPYQYQYDCLHNLKAMLLTHLISFLRSKSHWSFTNSYASEWV